VKGKLEISVSQHCKRRYVERIVGETNENEIRVYLSKNDERLTGHIKELFNHAELVYQGQIGDNVTRKFWLKDDIVLITDTGENKIITLYRINFNFPKELTKQVIDSLVTDLKSMQEEVNVEKEKIDSVVQENNTNIETLKKEIAYYKSKIESIEFDINECKNTNASLYQNITSIHRQIDMRAAQLFNSQQYAKDLKSGNM
jgi:hypothetical protein